MKTSEIKFTIHTDEKNIPSKIFWEATEKQPAEKEEVKAICVSLWDGSRQNTLKIDLWADDMPVDDMRRFYIETIGGLAESLKNATGDEVMVSEINDLCDRLGKYIENNSKIS